MAFKPIQFPDDAPGMIEDLSGAPWTPMFQNACSFNSEIFLEVLMNHIRNPNINSSWLFRADILVEADAGPEGDFHEPDPRMRFMHFRDFKPERALVRKLIPRNTLRDQPLDQTCLIFRGETSGERERLLIVYNPHFSSEDEIPFYHPKVRALAYLYEWNVTRNEGLISIHYNLFSEKNREPKLVRTALNLLLMVHKHGEGSNAGYVKRVYHDTIIPQATIQTTYAKLKDKYARNLIETWAEVTDPSKHVFEDLSIAAFLIELWAQMYQNTFFPGFVDIGCGNGLLVYILVQEGYPGWGFDARIRKSWDNYNAPMNSSLKRGNQSMLKQHVLLPSIIKNPEGLEEPSDRLGNDDPEGLIHDGRFPKGTFIISNHADELTPWTPVLATVSECPFIMIPCCSHDLSGARFRAPAPKQSDKSSSAYSSLVDWVSKIGADCGWEIEKEMLRIPSTRNTGLIGRKRTKDYSSIDLQEIMKNYGGTEGYLDNVMKLVKTDPRGH